MNALFNTLKVSTSKRLAALALAASGACMTLGAAPAQAGEFRGDRDNRTAIGVEFGFHDYDRRPEPAYAVRETKVWVEPVFRTVCDKVWVEPIYRTVTEQVYRAPETKTVCEKVWVPDRYEVRTTLRRDRGRVVRCEDRVLVEPAHYTTVERVVEVCPGRWETETRQELVCAGHFDNVEHRDLVTPGHYEIRRDRVVVDRDDHHGENFHVGFEYRKH